MASYKDRKRAVLGRLCRNGHDHGGGSYRDSSNSTCFECTAERIKRWSQTDNGRVKRKAAKERSALKIKESAKAYRKRSHDRLLAYNEKYRRDNPEWFAAYYRQYNAQRRALKRCAIPAWADLGKISEIYRQAQELTSQGNPHQVDHIVPLKSKLVCGLHCEANLQLLPGTDNQSKGNRWWPDMPL